MRGNNKNRLNPEIDGFIIRYRHLPHWESPEAVYFVTSRCIENEKLSEMDKTIVFQSLKHLDGSKYELFAAVVMDDHFHAIFKPLEIKDGKVYSLSSIMHSIKSFTAHKIGRKLWLNEYYDRIIRNEKEFKQKLLYLIMNPVRAGYVSNPLEYEWLYVAEGLFV